MFNLTVLNTLSFGTYAFLRDLVRDHCTTDGHMTGFHYALAGMGVGLAAAPISTPFELVKVQYHCITATFKQIGVFRANIPYFYHFQTH